MRETERGERYVVFDDFLSPSEFDDAVEFMGRVKLSATDSVVSPYLDGPALRSKGVSLPAGIGDGSPNGRPALYTRVAVAASSEHRLFGEPGSAWDQLTFTFWEYPPGSRLGWHNDAGRGRQGEFILYLHSYWDVSWGGELLLIDRDPGLISAHDAATPAELSQALLKCEVNPIAVLPRPNRLVLVRSNTVHTIHRVDESAGSSKRRSLTGFVYCKASQGGTGKESREALEEALLGRMRN
jgi:hypothetical protein